MSTFNSLVPIVGTLTPANVGDTYATHEAKYGKGGCIQVGTKVQRDAIPTERRVEGMLVVVTSDTSANNGIYTLDGGVTNNDWALLINSNYFTSTSTTSWGGITGTLSAQTDLQNALNSKFDDPAGTTAQYIRGDGSLSTFPTIPTQTSQLTNDSGFLTSVPDGSAINASWGDITGTLSAQTDLQNALNNKMSIATYDSTANGVVDVAASVEGVGTAGNSTYYGKDGGGTVGFHSIDYTTIDNTPITVIESDLNLYVNANTGSDNNSGLSSGSPLESLQKAIVIASTYKVALPYKVNIYLADGIYPNRCVLPSNLAYEVHVIGNETNPDNVSLTGTAANSCFSETGSLAGAVNHTLLISGAYCTIKGVKISGDQAGGRNACTVQFAGTAVFNNCHLGSAATGISVQEQGHAVIEYNLTVEGTFTNVFGSACRVEIRNASFTLVDLNSTNAFFVLTNNSAAIWRDTTITVSNTVVSTKPWGKYYVVSHGSVLTHTNVTGDTYGDTAGTLDTGGAVYGL